MSNSLTIALFVGAALLIVVLGTLASAGERRKVIPNYRSMFMLGICFLALGLTNSGFFPIAIVFLLFGVLNKDKWGMQTRWTDYPPKLKKIKYICTIGLSILSLSALALYAFSSVG